ncbi:MAG: TIM barrel protein [Anaerolineae bacterium]
MPHIRIGNAPCSWGILEFDLAGEAANYTQVLDEMAETGYLGTELGDWGFMPTDPAVLAAELTKRRLTMVGAFVPVAFKDPASHGPGVQAALKVARLLRAVADRTAGHLPYLVLADDNGKDPVRTRYAGRITPDMGLTDAEWAVFAAGAEKIARAVYDETGLRTVFHHHCAGYVETPDEISRLLSLTDPQVLGLVFDTGHYAFGAGDCAAVADGLRRFADRIWYIHFKDCQPKVAARSRAEGWDYFESVRHGVFCELGQGCVDFPAVAAWLEGRPDLTWGIVEQDVLPGMGTPKESARRNREYLRSIGL